MSGKGSFLEQICLQNKGYVDKIDKREKKMGEKKLCREQCEMDSLLQLDHTMIQYFSSFIP